MTRAVRLSLNLIVFLCAAAGLAAGMQASWHWYKGNASEPLFRTDHPRRASLVANIIATGTIEPEEVIDVGAQVAGQILSFGQDPADLKRTIDYGTPVEQGTVLARIDDSLYAPEVDIARADLGLCTADVRHAESELEQERSKLHKAERDWDRTKRLASAKSISQNDVDATQSAWEMAKAAVTAAEADLEKAKRAVDKARGTLGKAEKNLGYCTIKSPVKGVIIDRRVNVGQTVVSSLNAPSLFLIAKDLRRLQIWVSVNESDIGNIYTGQQATFTVDAYPADVFHGTVGQIRLNATMTQNVVTYTVVVNVDNEDGKLDPYAAAAPGAGGNPNPGSTTSGTRNRPDVPAGDKLLPYLTANLLFKVDERTDALLVPNAALHYRPSPGLVAPDHRALYEQGLRRATAEDGTPDLSSKKRLTRATIWVSDGDYVRPIKVRVGLTDGLMTEVVEVIKDQLTPETEIVTGENQTAAGREGTVNPFGPRPRKKSAQVRRPAVDLSRKAKMTLIRLNDVTKTYSLGEVTVPVLKAVSLEVNRGEMVALMGASGSGKSTLMNILGCLDRPSSGEYWLDGEEVSQATGDERALIRNRKIGFVFQSFNLLARTSALDNVIMPLAYTNSLLSNREARARGRAMLAGVGLADRMDHHPSQLSGGQQQRVAIARALINNPQILFADEPTGNLDSKTSKEILRMFQELSAQDDITVVLVTHDPGVAHYARRVIRISDGLIREGVYDGETAEPDPAAA